MRASGSVTTPPRSSCPLDLRIQARWRTTSSPSPPAGVPAITLVKTVDRTTLVAGQTATYTFVAQNTGNVTLTGVVISETQFSGTGAMSALTYTWPGGLPGVLLAGQTVTATATYVVTQNDVITGVLTNTAKVTGNPAIGPPVTATDDAEIKAPPPAWKIKKTATVNGTVPANGSVMPGQTINYAVTATSLSGIITGVILKDNLADVLDNATFVPGSATLTIGTGTPIPVANPVAPFNNTHYGRFHSSRRSNSDTALQRHGQNQRLERHIDQHGDRQRQHTSPPNLRRIRLLRSRARLHHHTPDTCQSPHRKSRRIFQRGMGQNGRLFLDDLHR